MQFTERQDVEAPIAFVFDQMTDFEGFERQALRRGADVRRRDTLARPGLGSEWDVRFPWRGRERHVQPRITAWEPPVGYAMQSVASGIVGDVSVDLVPLSRGRTRITLTVAIAPQNLTARLLVQSLKIAKGTISKRIEGRLASYARTIEDRHRGGRARSG